MSIPITGQPPVPDLSDPATFNTKALNLFTWITGSMLDQFNAVDPADWFGVQSDPLDAAAGKILISGAFGLGQAGAGPLLGNLNAMDTPAGFYRYAASTTGTKPSGIAADGAVIVARGQSANSFVQTLLSGDGSSVFTRSCVSGVLKSWVYSVSNLDAATTVEGRASVSLTKYMSPKVTAEAGFATGEKTWRDVLGVRSKNTPYRNTLGYPIEVCIQAQYIGSSIQVSLDGSAWTTLITNSGDGHISLSFPVPNNTYYRLVSAAGVLTRWVELY